MTYTNNQKNDKNSFLHPIKSYHGQFTPDKLAFNANLQEFAQKVLYICSLETNGKINSEDAYSQIKLLWKQLKQSKENLLDRTDFSPDSE